MKKVFSRIDRQGRLLTVLGKDALVLLAMTGTEELSGDFEWRVEALSSTPEIDLHALLGTRATVEIDHAGGTRAFDGIVCEAQARGATDIGSRYDLTLRPWLHVADLRRNMRIFHNKTVIQIVEEVLGAYSGLGDPHLDVQVTESYPILEYTVQYGETDANFVRRQLERHGISWCWRHKAGVHTLLLTDAEFNLPQVQGGARPYYGVDRYNQRGQERFDTWFVGDRITTGAIRLTEYNFKIPKAAQKADHTGHATHPSGEIESFDWPGDYLEQDQGRGVASRRIEEERGQSVRHKATGDVASLGAGWRVTLSGDTVPNATGLTFICLKAEHRFREQSYGTSKDSAVGPPYEGTYVLMPDDTPFRPERRTPARRVEGPETAFVVGEGEIDCDEHGRILCRFHWDLEGAHTMRVRVSQNWASKGWGGMVIPRIGMEVIVEHLRGDPDKPIVTGCVYNGANTTPYELPQHKTRSTFKTDTHQGTGFNELRFEDQANEEEIRVIAQKDLNTLVKNSEARIVMNDSATAIFDNRLLEVFGNAISSVSGSYTTYVGATGAMAMSQQSMGSQSHTLSSMACSLDRPHLKSNGSPGDYTLITDGSYEMTIGQSHVAHVNDNLSETIGKSLTTQVQRNRSVRIGGDDSTNIERTKTEVVGDKIVIVCGSNRFEMHSDGYILLKGVRIEVDGSSHISATSNKIDLN